ncbi:MAG: hypothetical protein II530_04950 [Bacteroidaceae bacterium]|nr:hypothetical protein [Bacteroidaceae bacterium]
MINEINFENLMETNGGSSASFVEVKSFSQSFLFDNLHPVERPSDDFDKGRNGINPPVKIK